MERGTARSIKYGFYKIAGKTGTAQKLIDKKYTDLHITSFVGYFPADKPRYSCIIVVDSPQGSNFRFGSEVHAPIFKDIVDRIAGKDIDARGFINDALNPLENAIHIDTIGYTNELVFLCKTLHLPLPLPIDIASKWSALKIRSNEATLLPCRPTLCQKVPNVRNMKLRDALYILEYRGLEVQVEGPIHGTIYRQSLPPYVTIPADRKISIYLK